ncbi:MAG: hypothetical protein U5L96_14355 [Owenweeksia sp.]|nr:hypothetical protein [Owenweeksia sp.]
MLIKTNAIDAQSDLQRFIDHHQDRVEDYFETRRELMKSTLPE